MEPNNQDKQTSNPVAGCLFAILAIGFIGVLFCLFAFLYSENFGSGFRSVEGWIFKAAFVFIVMFGVGVLGLSLCGIDVSKMGKSELF